MNDEMIIAGSGPTRRSVFIEDGTPIGYQQYSVTSGAVVPFSAIPPGANRAMVQIETDGDAYWRDDNGVPTATLGMHLFAGNSVDLKSALSIKQFQIIAVSATVKMNVSFYIKQ